MLSLNSRSDETHRFKKFFIRRFFRIAPLYWLALLYYTQVKVVGLRFFMTGVPANPIDAGKFLSNLFFVHGFHWDWINSYVPGGWSIADEVIFYSLLPLLFTWIKDINACIRFIFFSLMACMALEYSFHDNFPVTDPFLYFYFPAQLPVFLLGILAYFILQTPAKISPSSLVLMTLTIFISCYFSPPFHIIYSLVFFGLLIFLSNRPYRLLVNPVMAYLGKISFSVYIIHFTVIQILSYFRVYNPLEETSIWTTWINLLFRFLLTLGITVVIAHFSYRFVERRFELIGKGIIKKLYG